MDKYFSYNDRQGYYTDEGDGETILFVHGFAEDGNLWRHFSQGFPGYRHIIPDLPGFGGSELAAEELTVELMADFVYALLARENVKKIHYVGHSMGGYAGLAFAEKHPDMLKSFTLFHSHPFADSAEKRENRLRSIAIIEKHGTGIYMRELYNNLFGEGFLRKNTDFVEEKIREAQQYPVKAVQAALKAMALRPDRSGVLKTIGAPVLFIIGKDDKAIPHDKSIGQTVLPPACEVEILEGTGHMGMYEKGEKCQEIVRNFIKSPLIV